MFDTSDPMRVDNNNDYNSDDDDYDMELDKLILSFLRLKEIDQLSNLACNPQVKYKKLVKKQVKQIENYDLMDLSDYDDKEVKNNFFTFNSVEKTLWFPVWNKIIAELNDLKRDNPREYLRTNTHILKLHLKNSVNLDSKCFVLLNGCLEPNYIEKLFDQGRINLYDSSEMTCLYDRQIIFNNLQLGLYGNRSIEPCQIIASLTVLLYKSKCLKQKNKIIDLINKKLTVFINREQYHKKFRQIFIKHFLKAVYLNGLFTYDTLCSFLNSSNRNLTQGRVERDSDSDEDMSDDDDDEDDFDDDDDDENMSDITDTDSDGEIRPNIRQNQPERQVKTVAKLIELSPDEYKCSFPLSLKNLCRISIKNSMPQYSYYNVQKLTVLSNVFRDFILFKQEIDSVVKICNELSDTGSSETRNDTVTRQRIPFNDLRIFV
ncbi:unnamed protein product [Brachionus calyciflorus]|uniref:SOCS box domain-containing protein n=1 Tax=Brachionus calyciflorus TaxID=104777 RepID=A0A814Q085_9BILA|nr:unnamed protein product [Brachionus calyciflorus]